MKPSSPKFVALVVFAAFVAAAITGVIFFRNFYTPDAAESERGNESVQSPEKSVENAFARLPLVFEAAPVGKKAKSAAIGDFVSRGAGYRLALRSTEAVMTFEKSKTAEQETAPAPATLKMRLEKANKQAKPAGEAALAGKLNYFVGSDRKNWRTDVSAFQKVRYESVYKGVDVVYYGKQRQLEYDFVVAPEADPKQIELAFDGAQNVNVNADGALVLQMPDGGEVRFEKPFSYQEVNGEKQEVASRYAVKENNRVGFEVAEYDRAAPLVIDPVLNYFTYLGGGFDDEARAVAVDNAGNFYVGGTTNSGADLPLLNPLRAQIVPLNLGEFDAFVSKFNAGGELIFSTYFGGSNAPNEINGLAVDAGGNAYLTGTTRANDFPTTTNAFDNTKTDQTRDAFVVKLGAAGNNLLYASFFGGSGGDIGRAIAVNENGRAFITGATNSGNMPITPKAYSRTPSQATTNANEVFVAEINTSPAGCAASGGFNCPQSLAYSTFLPGEATDEAFTIDLDSSGKVWIGGDTTSTDFPTKNAFQNANGDASSGFLTRLDTNPATCTANAAADCPQSLMYSTFFGTGIGYLTVRDLAVDAGDNIIIAGDTTKKPGEFPLINAVDNSCGAIHAQNARCDMSEHFVSKFNASGSSLIYSTYLGGDGEERYSTQDAGYGGLAVDASGNVFVTGTTTSANFPILNPLAGNEVYSGRAQTSIPFGDVYGGDAFVTALTPAGALISSTFLGGTGYDNGNAIAVAPSLAAGTVYVVGYSDSVDFTSAVSSPLSLSEGSRRTFNAFAVRVDMFAASAASYTVSGRVTNNGSGASNIRVVLRKGDSFERFADTDANGNYSFGGIAAGGYTVTPSTTNLVYTPTARSITVAGNTTGVDFSARPLINVTGTLTLNSQPFFNSAVRALQNGTQITTAVPDENGHYNLKISEPGVYQIVPVALTGNVTWSPASRTINLTGDLNAQNFNAVDSFSVGGQTTENGSPLGGVTLRLRSDSGFLEEVTSNATTGNFSFPTVAPGIYTLTAAKTAFNFAPQARVVTVVNANVAGQAFAGTRLTRNNGRIAFSSRNNPQDNREIYTIDATGGDVQRLTNNTETDTEPSYSPDGSQIVIQRGGNLHRINADGTGSAVQLTTGGKDEKPAWSPDGTQIAFVREVTVNGDNNLEIFVMASDGSAPRNITNDAATDRDPAWSADGKGVYFASNRDGDYEIYAVNSVNQSAITQLTINTESDDSPAISPADNSLVYVGVRGGNPDIFTQGGTNLTNNTAEDGNPAFSPDGQQIVFTRSDGDTEIFTMSKTGGSQTQRTFNTATDTTPDWGATATSCAAAPDSIVSWFKGENNAFDAHGANNGVTIGATYAAGRVGNGFKFDGVDDSVSIPDAASLKPANVSVEAWVKFDSLASNTTGGAPNGLQYLIFKKNSRVNNFEGYALLKYPDNKLVFAVTDANGVTAVADSGTTTVTTGEFYHVVGKYDGSRVRIYVNGNQVGSTNATLTLDYGTRPVFLGTSGEAYDGKFNGVLDEVTIYNDDLSLNTIVSLYNAGSVGKCPSVPCSPVSNNLVNWYRGQNDATDSAGTNNGTTVQGAPSYTAGRVGNGIFFNGTSAININRTVADDFSIEFWMKSSQTAGGTSQWYNGYGILDGELSGGTTDFGVSLGAGKILFGTGDGDHTISSAASVSDFQWHHVVVTREKTTGAKKIYIDGAESAAGTGSTASLTAPTTLALGGGRAGSAGNYFGSLDEVKIYNRALTLTEVQNAFTNNCTGDANPSLSINDQTVTEGNTGTTNATFTVTLSPALSQTFTVNYATANGTAVAPADYTAVSGTLTFAPGETTKTIVVPVVGDTTDETNETFKVSLSNLNGGLLGDIEGIGTITDDDEGGAACSGANYELQNTLASSTGSAPPISYIGTGQNFTTETVNGSSRTVLSFPGGNGIELRPTLGVIANNEYDIFVHFRTSDAFSWNRLIDFKNGSDDGLYIRDGYLKFYGTAHGDISSPTRVFTSNNYATLRLTRTAAGSFSAYVNGVLQFTLNDAAINAAVISSANALRFFQDNGGEHYAGAVAQIQLSSPTGNCTVGSLSINDATVTEGNTGTTNATFTVTLSPANPQTVTVAYTTENITATAGADYTTTSGTLTFAPNETTKTVSVPVIGDTADEPNETFRVRLSNPTNALIGDGEGIGTITDNDDPPASGATFNASNEFALTQGGTTGVWNYGYSASDTDNTLTLFSPTEILTQSSGCSGGTFEKWLKEPSGDQIPQISRHNPALTCSNIPANAVFIHPGRNNQRAVLRFNAPTSGTFQIAGAFQKQNLGATTDLKIIKNGGLSGETVLNTNVIGAVYQQTFNFTVSLAAGDKIDFSVGDGDNGQNGDGSSIVVTIGQPVTACLTAPANLQVFVPGENSPNDVASNNNIGTLVGDAGYAAGKAGQALNFDGNGDYLSLPDNAAQRPATAVTAEGWFKFDNPSGLVSLISKPIRNSTLNSYTLYLQDGQLRGLVSNGPQYTRALSNFSPQAGVWHHLAFTYNLSGGVSTLKLYANGVDVTSSVDGTANIQPFYDASPYPLLIGGELENNSPAFFLDGQADEVSVYGRALTQPEIFSIVRQGSYGKCGGGNPQCTNAPTNQVAWYRGEGNANDSAGTNNGTANGATYAAGRVGQAMNFDGVDDYVSVPDSNALDITGDLTIEGWVYPTSSNAGRIVSKQTVEGYQVSYVLEVNGGLRFYGTDGTSPSPYVYQSQTLSVPLNQWSHIAFTLSASSLSFVVNGTAESYSGNLLGVHPATDGPLYIGTSRSTVGAPNGDKFFSGRIDEMSLYNRVLTTAELQAIYNAGSAGKCTTAQCLNAPNNHLSWFKGENNANDSQGTNNGTNYGATFSTGRVGQGFAFDGNDYVQTPSINLGANYALEFWMNPTANSTPRNIISNNFNSATNYGGLYFYTDTAGAGHLEYYINGAGTANTATAAGSVPVGVWSHVGVTYDGSVTRLYVNGVLAATGAAHTETFNNPLIFGSGLNAGAAYFLGSLDEISLYSRTLSANEIQSIAGAGGAGKCAGGTTYSIVGRVTNGANGLANVSVALSGSSSATVTTDSNGNYSFTNLAAGGNYTVTPTLANYAFTPVNRVYNNLAANVTNADFAAAQCAAAPTGLQNWYKFEGNAADVFNLRPGTAQGNPAYAAGRVGQAITLDGADDSVDFGNWFNYQTFSLSLWINVAPFAEQPSFAAILDNNHTGSTNWVMHRTGSANSFHFGDNAGGEVYFTPTANTWQLLTVTRDATAGIKVYLDGALVGEDTTVGTIPYNGAQFLRLGRWGGGGRHLKGQIDEFDIYDRVLTQAQIQAMYNAGGTGKCAGGGSQCVNAPNNQVAWFKGENNANDSAGTNNAALQNGATFAAGKVGQAFSFDGVDDYVQTPINMTAQTTIETWVNPSILTGGYTDGSFPGVTRRSIAGAAADFRDFSIGLYGGKFGAFYRNSSGVAARLESSVTVQTGVWYHVAATIDGTTARLYVNGNLEASGATATNYTPYPNTRIGSVSCCAGDNFGGLIDEVGFYSRALTQNELQSIYNAGQNGKCTTAQCVNPPTNHVLWFKGENNANDSQGANNGTNNGATYAAGKVGQAFQFTADPQHVLIPDSAVVRPTNLTIETWAYSTTASGVRVLFAKALGTSTADSYVLWQQNGNLNAGICANASTCYAVSAPTVSVNEWHHIVMTFDDASDSLRLFVDGAQVAAGTTSLSIGYDSHSALIGADYTNETVSEFWRGLIDETSLYSRALTAAEIAAIYNAGAAGKCAGGGTTTYTISGRIASGGNGLSGIAVALTGASSASTTTDGSGNYSFTNLAGGTYTVTPTPGSYALSPTNRTYTNLAANVTDADFNDQSICTFTFNSNSNAPYPAAGGTGSFNVVTQPGCQWTAATDSIDEWAMLNAPISGIGSGTVNYTVVPNQSGIRNTALFINNGISSSTAHFVSQLAGAGTCPQVTPITYGSTTSGALTTSDCRLNSHYTDHYSFSGIAGERVMIRMTSGNLYPSVVLHNTAATQVYDYSINGTYGDARIPNSPGFFTLPATGTYIISVSEVGYGNGTGNYTLLLHSDRTVPSVAPPSGLVGWFAGEGDTRNQQGAGTGTFNGAATYATDYVGQSFDLNGTNRYVEVPAAQNAFNAASLSVEAWVNTATLNGDPNTTTTPKRRNIASKYNGTGGASWSLDMEQDGALVFYVYDGTTGNFRAVRSQVNLAINQWTHVAATFDAATQGIRLFFNGVLRATLVAGSASSVAIGQNNFPVRIGAYQSGGTMQGFWHGKLDEVSIYNRALTANEVAALIDAGRIGKIKQAAVASQTTATLGAATVTFPAATSGALTETALDRDSLPALPSGSTARLAFDVSTTATFSGNAVSCFAVPSMTAAEFANLRVLHREGNNWIDRTAPNNSYPNLCASTTSFSPFVIATGSQSATSLSGKVTYGITPSGQSVKNVVGATLNAAGSTPLQTTSDSSGNFSLSGFGSGAYTVTPTKTTGAGQPYTTVDATRVLQAIVGLATLTPAQAVAADSDATGDISTVDASNILRAIVGLPNIGDVGQWRFIPATRSYASITSGLTNQNFEAVVIGDVDGDWDPNGGRGVSGEPAQTSQTEISPNDAEQPPPSEKVAEGEAGNSEVNQLSPQAVAASLPNTNGQPGTTAVIPITVGSTTDANITGFNFVLTFNSSVVVPAGTGNAAISRGGTLSQDFTCATNTTVSGQISIACAGDAPLEGAGTLLNLRLTVAGATGTQTALTFSQFRFNAGNPGASATNGQFTSGSVPTAALATISGRILDGRRGIRNALVTLTDARGATRTVLTGTGGGYRFTNVEVGQSVIITTRARRFVFAPSTQVLSVLEDMENVNFSAQATGLTVY